MGWSGEWAKYHALPGTARPDAGATKGPLGGWIAHHRYGNVIYANSTVEMALSGTWPKVLLPQCLALDLFEQDDPSLCE